MRIRISPNPTHRQELPRSELVDDARNASVACTRPDSASDGKGEAVLSQSGTCVAAMPVAPAPVGLIINDGVSVAGRSADVAVVDGDAAEGVADGEALGKLVAVTEAVANVPVGVGDGVAEGISVGRGVGDGDVGQVDVGVLVPPVGVTVGIVWLSRAAWAWSPGAAPQVASRRASTASTATIRTLRSKSVRLMTPPPSKIDGLATNARPTRQRQPLPEPSSPFATKGR